MKEDLSHRGAFSGGGSGSYKPSKWKTIANCWRSKSANASSIASTVRIMGGSYGSQSSGVEEEQQREQVLWAGFELLDLGPTNVRHVLLLAYQNGFQVWDVESAKDVKELVSRRDGPVSYLHLQPSPCTKESNEGRFRAARPLLLVVSGEISCSVGSVAGGYNTGHIGYDSALTGSFTNSLPNTIRFYSLQTHQYVHTLRPGAGIYGVRCTSRVVAVAFVAQIYCYDADTLQSILSVLTYPNLQAGPGGGSHGLGAMAVGPRWLAYAANQPLVSCTGRASPQHLTPSPGVSPSTSPANGNLVAYYANLSSKQLAAGILSLGDMGYKTLSRYYSELHLDGTSSPGSGSPRMKSNSCPIPDPENAGTVIVRDFVSKAVVAQFRAHTSPLSALSFNQSGTLLVTASVHGHNFNVFLLLPQSSSLNMPMAHDSTMSYVHLYKLTRGITNAVVQDIVFSSDSRWICVSSSRGTSHLYAISPFGGPVGHHTHGVLTVNGIVQSKVAPLPVMPWWSSNGPAKLGQQSLSPPPTLVLSVVNRIKNGPIGWIGTVSGAAAAATGRTSSSGAVAAVFYDGGDYDSEIHDSSDALDEKLWVLCASGHLVRYLLRPSTGHVGFTDGNAAEVGSPGFDSYQGHEFGLHVERLEKWDVCRRSNWTEREERIYAFASEADSEDAVPGRITNHLVEGDDLKAEDRHRLYISKAEIQLQQTRSFPIWAKPNISFEVLLLEAKKDLGNSVGQGGGELEIEKIPTRVIELRRKDLTPVVEKFRSQDLREEDIENLSIFPKSNNSSPRIDLLHGELVGRNTASPLPIRRIGFGRELNSIPGNDLLTDGFIDDDGLQVQPQLASSTAGSRMVHRNQLSISELDAINPLSRASVSSSNHEQQNASSDAMYQKFLEKVVIPKNGLRFQTVLAPETNSTRLTDMGNRDDSKEDVKTVNADIKTSDAIYRSGMANIRVDARSVRNNAQVKACKVGVPYGSDDHPSGKLEHHETVTGQNTWTLKDEEKDVSVVLLPVVNALHLQSESMQGVSKKALEGVNKLHSMDSLEDADGSDSFSQQDENTAESVGEVWDGAMFPFNEESSL